MKIVALLWLVGFTAAVTIVDSGLASACMYYINQFEWDCATSSHGSACLFTNVNYMGSVAHCIMSEGNSQGEIDHAYVHITKRAMLKGNVEVLVAQVEAYAENATAYLRAPPTNVSEVLYSPVSVDEAAFVVYRESFKQILHHVFKTTWFGWGLVFFWLVLLVLLTVENALWTFWHASLMPATVGKAVQKHLLPVTFVFGLSRLDLVIMAVYVVQTVVCTAVSYTVSLPNVYINDVYFLTLDLIGYRSGIISFSLMPVAYIFGIRNNPFCILTGLPQAVFIKYHKFVALIMSLEALVHSAVWTAYAIHDAGLTVYQALNYWQWGIVGTVVLFVMIGQSPRFIRNHMYETFLVLHKVLGCVFIVAMWYHCIGFGWMGWIYSLIAITVYDRVVRFFKIFFINRGYTQITVNVVDDKICKFVIPKSELHDVFYKPGSHIYISFYHTPIWYTFYQSHPFTIISSPVTSGDSIIVYARIKKGITGKLGKLKTDSCGNVEMWLLIDGPYGGGVETFGESEQLVGIAGGLGLSALLPQFYASPKGAVLHWVTRNLADIDYLAADLDYLRARGTDVRVYVTNTLEKSVLTEEKLKYVSVVSDRPDVDQWVAEAQAEGLAFNKKDIYLYCCGPGHMDNDVLKSVCERTDIALAQRLHYRSQNFQW